jgi:hypothetical protein
LLCEGRVENLTIGSGEQKTGPELLEPGSWYYYIVTVDSKFNPNSDNLGIQWIVGLPSSPPNNYSNAYISFDQGPLHRWVKHGTASPLQVASNCHAVSVW